MRDAAGNHVAPRQDLLEFQTGAFVENVDRADGEVDLVGLQRGPEIRKVAVALIDPNVGMCDLKLGAQPCDQRIH